MLLNHSELLGFLWGVTANRHFGGWLASRTICSGTKSNKNVTVGAYNIRLPPTEAPDRSGASNVFNDV